MSRRWRIDAAGGALELWLAEGAEAVSEAQARDVVDTFCWQLSWGKPDALRIATEIEQVLSGHLAPALGWEPPVDALERSALGRQLAISEPGMRLLGHAHEGVKSNKEYADENWTGLNVLPWADAASPHAKIACNGKIIKGAGL